MKWLKGLKQKWVSDKRLVVKAILWELTGLITLYIWLVIFQFNAAKTSLSYFVVRITSYYVYHKWWKQTKWLK